MLMNGQTQNGWVGWPDVTFAVTGTMVSPEYGVARLSSLPGEHLPKPMHYEKRQTTPPNGLAARLHQSRDEDVLKELVYTIEVRQSRRVPSGAINASKPTLNGCDRAQTRVKASRSRTTPTIISIAEGYFLPAAARPRPVGRLISRGCQPR
jgi:hypothetical protein